MRILVMAAIAAATLTFAGAPASAAAIYGGAPASSSGVQLNLIQYYGTGGGNDAGGGGTVSGGGSKCKRVCATRGPGGRCATYRRVCK